MLGADYSREASQRVDQQRARNNARLYANYSAPSASTRDVLAAREQYLRARALGR